VPDFSIQGKWALFLIGSLFLVGYLCLPGYVAGFVVKNGAQDDVVLCAQPTDTI
jgi:hypothetical protein